MILDQAELGLCKFQLTRQPKAQISMLASQEVLLINSGARNGIGVTSGLSCFCFQVADMVRQQEETKKNNNYKLN